MFCTRPGAINIGSPDPCKFLVGQMTYTLVLDEEKIEPDTGDMTYYATFHSTNPTGLAAGTTLQLIVVALQDAVYSSYSFQYTTPAVMWADDVLEAMATLINDTYTGQLQAVAATLGTADKASIRIRKIDGGDMYSGNAYTSGGQATCYLFEEVTPEDRSLTFSYYPSTENWMYLHAYAPNDYGRDRVDCFAFDSGNIYRMNHGPRGNYTGQAHPFIIEMVFREQNEIIIDNVMWRSVIENAPFDSFSYITVSTRHFSTGRVPINERKIQGWFSFNRNRDIVISLPFRSDVYNDYGTIQGSIDATRAWFKRGLIEDQYVLVRLEYIGNANIVFLEANAQVTNAYR